MATNTHLVAILPQIRLQPPFHKPEHASALYFQTSEKYAIFQSNQHLWWLLMRAMTKAFPQALKYSAGNEVMPGAILHLIILILHSCVYGH